MEFHQLRYFCTLARTGSFTKAADEEGIAQPSLSQQIRRLEAAVGAPLFVRLGRSVQLTVHGETLLPHAKRILQDITDGRNDLAHLEEGTRGPVRVGVIPTILPYLLAPHLGEFAQLYPEVELRLSEDTTQRLVERLQSGDLELAILRLPVRNRDIVVSELLREPMLMAVAKNHRLAKERAVDLREMYRERLLLLKEGHCFREDMLTACTRARAEFHSVFESDHFGTILPMVAAGAGVTLVPQMAASQAVNCAVIALAKPQIRRVGYARIRSRMASKPLKAFIAWLRNVGKAESALYSDDEPEALRK